MKSKPRKCVIAGAILAGGNASRLDGVAKGTIEVDDGVSIIGKLIEELIESGIGDIVIVANDSKPYRNCSVKIISDIRAGMGPMGGIESGLVHFAGKSDAVMFVPCDMPNITAEELLVLKEAFMETKAPVVFAETTGFFWHPLCVIVHNDLRKMISSAIDKGQRKIRDVWKEVKSVSVPFGNETAFFNINSLEDMNRWLRSSKMRKRICAEISIADKLRQFLDSENIALDIVTGQPGDIEVCQCTDRKESDLDIIYSGGWITCKTARSLAEKMEISLEQMGKLLNHLDVKIRECGLGCFR